MFAAACFCDSNLVSAQRICGHGPSRICISDSFVRKEGRIRHNCFTTRVLKTLNFYKIISRNTRTMDLSNILVQAVTANSVDGDYWGFTRQSDEESSSEGKGKKFLNHIFI